MAFNFTLFKTRAFTAILFAIVMVTGLLWNQWSFLVLFVIIHFGCWFDFIKLIRKIHPQQSAKYILLGLLYITLPIALIIYLRIGFFPDAPDKYSKILPCLIIFSIWINDTMAYIIGSLIGKTSLTKISPNKTVEGTVGGIILCVAIIALLSWLLQYNIIVFVIIALLCAVFGTLGDLFESKLKRIAGVKDSGTLMPGHGGFLDRFDSFLMAVPFVSVYAYFFVQ